MVRHSEKYIVITNYLDQSLKPGNEISTDHVYFPVVFFFFVSALKINVSSLGRKFTTI